MEANRTVVHRVIERSLSSGDPAPADKRPTGDFTIYTGQVDESWIPFDALGPIRRLGAAVRPLEELR